MEITKVPAVSQEKIIYTRPILDPLQRSSTIQLYFLWISRFSFTMLFFIRRNFGFCVFKKPYMKRESWGFLGTNCIQRLRKKNKQTYTASDIDIPHFPQIFPTLRLTFLIESIGKLRWCADAKWNASVGKVGSKRSLNVASLELSALEFVKGHLFKPNKIKLIIQVIQAFRTNLVKAFLDNLIYYH